jgi:hypothetical protein
MGERTGIGISTRARLAFGLNALRRIGSDLPKLEADDGEKPGIGHNGGPSLEEDPPARSWSHYCWKRAHKAAWKTPPREIALRRLRRAEELGMTYEEYTAIILDRGVFL